MYELTLKEIQAESLKILKFVRDICNNEGITFSLAWGTLLGAVRHEGFIPWDDDVDIMMPRNDYERFISIWKRNSQAFAPYELMHYTTNDEYVYVLSRVSNSNYKVNYKDVLDYGLGTFIDIYPLDGLGNDYRTACENMKKNEVLMRMIKLLNTDRFQKSPNGFLHTILKSLPYSIARVIGRKRLIAFFDKKCQEIKFDDSVYVGIPTVEIMESCIIKKEWIEKLFLAKFEDDAFPIPQGYDELLKHRYGDYMSFPPREQQIAHHCYSVYKK